MRLFLSYANEQRETAEAVALSLRGRGHEVFFDRHDLPPGGGYDARIDTAIRRSHAFIFLISPESVAPGRYTLTELAFARAKWPSPSDRVLPVMVAPTPTDAVPQYLRAVTILVPAGNIPAEVARAIDELRRLRLPVRLTAAAIALLAAAAILYVLTRSGTAVSLEAGPVQRHSAGLFGERAVYRIPISIRNVGDAPVDVSNVAVETEPPDLLEEQRESNEPGKELTGNVVFRTSPASLPGTSSYETFVYVAIAGAEPVRTFHLCADVGASRECTAAREWRLEEGEPDVAFAVPDAIALSAVAVAADADGFILATRTPNALHRLSTEGRIVGRQPLDGEPLVLDTGSLGHFVGLRPGRLARIDPRTLGVAAQRELAVPAGMRGRFSGVVSTTPASMAQTGTHVFVVTRGGASDSALFVADGGLELVTMAPYAPDVSFDLQDVELSSDAGVVWGTQTNTTPASLFRFSPSQHTVYGGHDFESVSCARGMAVAAAGLLLPACDATLQLVERPGREVVVGGTRGRLPLRVTERDVWSVFRMISMGERVLAAINLIERPAAEARHSLIVQQIDVNGARVLLELGDAHVRSMAARENVIMIVLEHRDGRRDALALRVED